MIKLKNVFNFTSYYNFFKPKIKVYNFMGYNQIRSIGYFLGDYLYNNTKAVKKYNTNNYITNNIISDYKKYWRNNYFYQKKFSKSIVMKDNFKKFYMAVNRKLLKKYYSFGLKEYLLKNYRKSEMMQKLINDIKLYNSYVKGYKRLIEKNNLKKFVLSFKKYSSILKNIKVYKALKKDKYFFEKRMNSIKSFNKWFKNNLSLNYKKQYFKRDFLFKNTKYNLIRHEEFLKALSIIINKNKALKSLNKNIKANLFFINRQGELNKFFNDYKKSFFDKIYNMPLYKSFDSRFIQKKDIKNLIKINKRSDNIRQKYYIRLEKNYKELKEIREENEKKIFLRLEVVEDKINSLEKIGKMYDVNKENRIDNITVGLGNMLKAEM